MLDTKPNDRPYEFTPDVGDHQFFLALIGMPMAWMPMAYAFCVAKRDPAMAARAVHVSARAMLWCVLGCLVCMPGTVLGLFVGLASGGGARGAWIGIAVGSIVPLLFVLAAYFVRSGWVRKRDLLRERFHPVHWHAARSIAAIVDGYGIRGTRIESLVTAPIPT